MVTAVRCLCERAPRRPLALVLKLAPLRLAPSWVDSLPFEACPGYTLHRGRGVFRRYTLPLSGNERLLPRTPNWEG